MQKIHAQNFKAIKDMEIELNHALLLIGEQAAGKSAVSKLVYFFKSLRQDFTDLLYDGTPKGGTVEKAFRRKVWEKFYNYFGSTRHLHPEFQARYNYTSNAHVTLSLYPDKGLKIYFEQNFYQQLFFNDSLKALTRRVEQYANPANAYERKELQQANANLEAYIGQIFNDARLPLFIPAGRNITVNYPEPFKLYSSLQSDLAQQQIQEAQSVDLYLMLRFLEHTERMKQRFQSGDFATLTADKLLLGNTLDEDVFNLVQIRIEQILKGKYSYDQFGEKLYFEDEQFAEKQYVWFRNASSGQQEAIRILQDIFLALLDGIDVFRVIEEPEAHLYPLAQKWLIELFAILLHESDSQVILTTHSPYVLSVMNNLLFAWRVAAGSKQASQRAAAIIPEACWLDPDTTNVYLLKNGGAVSILDTATGLIGQNYLDDISEYLGEDFAELYELRAEAFA